MVSPLVESRNRRPGDVRVREIRAALTIAFTDDGQEVFFPLGDPVQLADRLYAVLRSFEASPDRICCVSGLHDPDDHLPGACR
jgi:hypothetical protein